MSDASSFSLAELPLPVVEEGTPCSEPAPSGDASRSLRANLRRPSSIPPSARVQRRFADLEAASRAMQEVFALVARLAPTDITLTLTGPTGAGKDVLAHAIHAESKLAQGPFVVFDCGAVAPNLVESELFGHERGSFTGALSSHAGAFERARGGTLFLDEVGELPLDLQPRLLRALENRSIRRVGGAVDRAVDVRVIAATHCDLRAMVARGTFREDLYFRLAAAVVSVPPLRARCEDLPLLVPRLLSTLGRPDVDVASDVWPVLRAQSWPGNVRELKNVLACALAFVDDGPLEAHHLHLAAPSPDETDLDRLPLGGVSLARLERAAIKQTLLLTGGVRTAAAEALGIAASTLYDKLRKYGL